MQWYCRRPSTSLSLLVQAVIIIACQYNSATNLVVAQEAQVENPCLICPSGATAGDDYAPYLTDPITCKELIDNAKLFETGSLWCAQYEYAGLFCCPTTPDDPCTLCPNGITVADDYQPYNNGDTCSDELDIYADFDAKSDTCTLGWGANIESHCCPSTEANNPCIICPDGATAGEDFVPYTYDWRTCKDLIEAALTFDAESEMCLVYAKVDEYYCCPSSTTEFDDYCNICPSGITAGDDFVPWSSSSCCKCLVQNAKIVYENGSVGCNYYKGYELSCCPGAGTADLESTPITPPSTTTTTPSISIILSTSIPTISSPLGIPDTTTTTSPTSSITTNNPTIVAPKTSYVPTPSPTPNNPLYIVEVTASVVGAVAACVGAAFAFSRWKQKMNSSATPTAVAASPNMTSSIPAATVPQSSNVYNTPMPSQPTQTQGPRSSRLDTSRSFKDLVGEIYGS